MLNCRSLKSNSQSKNKLDSAYLYLDSNYKYLTVLCIINQGWCTKHSENVYGKAHLQHTYRINVNSTLWVCVLFRSILFLQVYIMHFLPINKPMFEKTLIIFIYIGWKGGEGLDMHVCLVGVRGQLHARVPQSCLQ